MSDDTSPSIGDWYRRGRGIGPTLKWTCNADGPLTALDAKSGEERWATPIGPTFRWKGNSWSAGPSATPTVDGDRVFALGGNGDLVAAELFRKCFRHGKNPFTARYDSQIRCQPNPGQSHPRRMVQPRAWLTHWAREAGANVSPDAHVAGQGPGGPRSTVVAAPSV